jgi:hypothetical protein
MTGCRSSVRISSCQDFVAAVKALITHHMELFKGFDGREAELLSRACNGLVFKFRNFFFAA